jgi:hypothetical protein
MSRGAPRRRRRWLVQKQDLRLVRQRLGDHHAPLHAARQRHDLGILLVPQGESRSTFSIWAGFFGLPNRPAAELDRGPHRLERVRGQFLRHQADLFARRAIVAHDVVAVGEHRAGARIDDAANDGDQRRLAGAVRPEQRKNLAAADFEVDVLQRLKPDA